MSAAALGLILIAALAHASWNLFSKQASAAGRAVFIWLVAVVATVIYIPVVLVTVLVTRPHLHALNWVFMVGTGILEAGYFLFLQSGYRVGDLSLVYPIGRGSGALLAALAGIALFSERPGPVGIAGIAAIIAGIVLIGLPSPARSPAEPSRTPQTASAAAPGSRSGAGSGSGARSGPGSASHPYPVAVRAARRRAVAFALGTGAFIASYTLWDKYAVSTLGTPAVLQGYATFPVLLIAFAPLAARSKPSPGEVWRSFRPQVIGAGVLTPLAYMLVLAALSLAAVSAVAPAREISVLFGVLLGRQLLDERGMARKLVAAAAIVAGVIAVAIG